MHTTSLAVLPTAQVRVVGDDRVIMTRKLFDGLTKYCDLWGGPLTVFAEQGAAPSTDLDQEEFRREDLPFGLEIVDFLAPDLGSKLVGHGLVLVAVTHNQVHLAPLCRSLNIPCVYISEYSMKTRRQITRATVKNPLRRLVRYLKDYRQERRNRAAVRLADGVQCNGTPTYEAYRRMNPRPLLYFDTLGDEAAVITPAELDRRTDDLRARRPLRLIFSGRLIPMKGADHLVPVADELRRLGVAFEMRICGGGALEPAIRREVAARGLGDHVKLMGVLPYQAELVPMTKNWADLFVCCHRTGDPSCTYLEVMSCGVPIAGYDNEAFTGIVRESGVGWMSPMNDPRRLARRIADLDRDRDAIRAASVRAFEFGRDHTFEVTFQARIDHLRTCAGLQPG